MISMSERDTDPARRSFVTMPADDGTGVGLKLADEEVSVEVDNLSLYYGESQALKAISLRNNFV